MYNIRQARDWEKFRLLAWFNTLPYQKEGSNSSPYDIMKLETDPSAEELEQLRIERIEEETRNADDIINRLRARGYSV